MIFKLFLIYLQSIYIYLHFCTDFLPREAGRYGFMGIRAPVIYFLRGET